jgi:glycerophosphoryl diester phosphodiesterase
MSTTRSRSTRRLVLAGVVFASLAPAAVAAADNRHVDEPTLTGRAVLPVETYSDGDPAGAGVPNAMNDPDGDKKINGIQFPTPSQPVEGFSGIVEGRRRGEWLAMADNGFGNKANSFDFNIRAYYVTPDFKTADGGSGAVAVGDYIQFSDPDDLLDFPITNEGTAARVLTGADIDPESIQRAKDGTFWVGDEFGPWVLHFDAEGRLLHAPYELPGLRSPANPFLGAGTASVPGSGGFEAMPMSPNGRYLYPVLERALLVDATAAPNSRYVYEFDTRTGRSALIATYQTDVAGHFVADGQMLDSNRMLLIERDGGLGVNAINRKVYEVDLRRVSDNGTLEKTMVVDLAAIADPDGVSLPAIHTGDVGLGNPFKVTCESIEALRIVSRHELLLGCDNNFPNKGRNPNLADDNEFITVTF